MRERLNRDPSYDLHRHIVTGEKPPLSGDSNLRQYDAELDRNDPMDPFTAIDATGLTTYQPGDTNLVSGWTSGNGNRDQQAVDLSVASNCFDDAGDPDKATMPYGPKNTGDGGY